VKKKNRVVLIDNYDSFVYNLADMLGSMEAEVSVVRSSVNLAQITELEPTHLVISPGPGRPPNDVGVSCDAILHYAGRIPILGVCLGHQTIGYLYGAQVVPAQEIMHGKTSVITHNDHPMFANVDGDFAVGRYHSLALEKATMPDCLQVIATTDDGQEIMAVTHQSIPGIWGVQFHPESILTAGSPDISAGPGAQMLANFLALEVG